MDCYKKFTALSKTHRKNLQEITEPLQPQPEGKITHFFGELDKTNWVGIFPKTCIFCEKIRKTVKKKKAKVSTGWNKKLCGEYQEVAN